jgi:aspartate kinase
MKNLKKTLVMKFGGESLSSPKKIKNTAKIILKRKENFSNIVVVVSAMGNMTDKLLKLAQKISKTPPPREQDMLITVGERISMSLLAMALLEINLKAISFTGSQSGIITTNDHFNAKIIDVRPTRIISSLKKGKIAIVAGFQGVSEKKEITTLGRGGSDTTAVALASFLNAEKVEFYKGVLGVYSEDPKVNKKAIKYEKLNYKKALKLSKKGARVLHSRAIELALKNKIPLHILSYREYERNRGTIIGKERNICYKMNRKPFFEV